MARKETPTRRKEQTTLFDHHREPLHFPNRGTPSLDLVPSDSKGYRPAWSPSPFPKVWFLYHEVRYGGDIEDVAIRDLQWL